MELGHKKKNWDYLHLPKPHILFVWFFVLLAVYFYYLFIHFFFQGISATSEDIPNKIEDLRSECSSDFGGKDSVTSPDMDEVTHGKKGKWEWLFR